MLSKTHSIKRNGLHKFSHMGVVLFHVVVALSWPGHGFGIIRGAMFLPTPIELLCLLAYLLERGVMVPLGLFQ